MADIHSGSSDEDDDDYVPDDEDIRKAEIELSRNKTMMSSDGDVNVHSVSVVDDKAKAEELWKDFLSDDANASSSENVSANSSEGTSADLPKTTDIDSKNGTSQKDDGKSSITESEVNKKDLLQSRIKSGLGSFLSGTSKEYDGISSTTESEVSDLPQSVPNLPKKRFLGSFLSQVSQNKKPKMNMLQKSLKDWESFKQDEGISEDLQTFNRGKRGFLERQAFLSRSDLRSFEVEKSMRLSNKKK